MRHRLRKPGQYPNAALMASLGVVAFLTVPVLAAPGPELRCEDSKPAIAVPTTFELEAAPASSGDDDLTNHLLKPDASSAARGAFADEAASDVVDDAEPETQDDEDAPSDSALHSASELKAQPYKRQMYRRDI